MRAVLDACVLYPGLMRALLLEAARLGHYEPVVSPRILEEWARAARREGPGAEAAARAAGAAILRDFPGALVEPAPLPEGTDLPDPDDAHVLAAAIAAGAGFLVTRNHRDFPTRALARHGVAREDPDTLLRAFAAEDARLPAFVADFLAGSGEVPARAVKAAGLPRLGKLLRQEG